MQRTWILGAMAGIMAWSTGAAACEPGTLKARFRAHTAQAYSKVVTDSERGGGLWIYYVRAYNPTSQTVKAYSVILGCVVIGDLEPGAVKRQRCVYSGDRDTGTMTVYQISLEGYGTIYSGRICYDRTARTREATEDIEEREELLEDEE